MTTTPSPERAATASRAPTRAATFAVAMRPPSLAARFFGPDTIELTRCGARQVGDVLVEFASPAARRVLAEAEVLVTGWGAPALSEEDLDAATRLRFVLHAGGQAAPFLPASARARGIQAANAGLANSVPVAEFTVAMIVLADKSAFRARDLYRSRRAYIDREEEFPTTGNIGRTIGIVGASRIGRMVIERLAQFDLDLVVHDPYLGPEEAAALGARLLPLDDLMRESDVVSLHPPLNHETAGMIGRAQLGRMRDKAVLINTARGRIVDQQALVEELRGGRIEAILDVTDPEVLDPTHELYDLPNVFLTPHIAGSTGFELRRMGRQIGAELERITRGEPLAFPEAL
jgi:phosphoglycerate dehydrogenase-like enzyme